MDTKRIFVAIDVSNEVRSKVGQYTKKLSSQFGDVKVRWEKPENLHLTLKFAGHINPDQVFQLNAKVADLASSCPAFYVTIEGTGAFTKRNRANVLWLGVEVESRRGIQNRFDALVAHLFGDLESGVEHTKRDFKPHLTIARLKDLSNSQPLINEHIDSSFGPVKFTAGELVVYESKLTPVGSVYAVLAKHTLSGNG